MVDISGWQDFFLDISKLSDSIEREYVSTGLHNSIIPHIYSKGLLCALILALIFKKSSIPLQNVATLWHT